MASASSIWRSYNDSINIVMRKYAENVGGWRKQRKQPWRRLSGVSGVIGVVINTNVAANLIAKMKISQWLLA
jgi:hypothetical protein